MENQSLFPSLSAILALVFFLLMTRGNLAATDQIIQDRLATANNEFSFEIYRQVGASAAGGNLILSPTSILIGLGMIHAGANAETKSQLTTAMRLDRYNGEDSAIGQDFKTLISDLNSPGNNYTLRTANRLFGLEKFPFREEFLRTTGQYFGATLEPLNFDVDPEESRRKINDWVRDRTDQKITNLLPDGSIDRDTVLVIVNAIYFRGFWMNAFQKKFTKPETFHLSRKSQTTIDMMTSPVAVFNYHDSEELGAKVIELPYVGKEVSMFVFLPHDVEGLPGLESRLGSQALGRVFGSMKSTPVKVSLPKFVLDQGVSLKQFLEQMGMVDMFDIRRADLSGIDGRKQLYVTEAVHKAFIAVDEQGTEAAGATGFVIKTKSGAQPEPFLTFVADRPFLFSIVERSSGSVLFVGRLVVPPQPGSGDIGEFGKTAEQRCCAGGADNDSSSSLSVGAFLGLGLPLIAALLLTMH